jgi:hypothetical protein
MKKQLGIKSLFYQNEDVLEKLYDLDKFAFMISILLNYFYCFNL